LLKGKAQIAQRTLYLLDDRLDLTAERALVVRSTGTRSRRIPGR
jgi:hypothetical protein